MSTLKVNDPVTVDQKPPNPPLEGVVFYLGPVDFADGDDWVGVRLTGSSVGKGKNDGSVQGKEYFKNCPPNGGTFIRASQVHKRTLKKLEELRLVRELNGSGQSRPSSRSSSLTSKNTSVEKDDDDSSVSSMRSTATGASNRSRIEELRQRRLNIRSKNKLTSPQPKSVIGTKVKASLSSAALDTPQKAPSTPKTPNKESSPKSPKSTKIPSRESSPGSANAPSRESSPKPAKNPSRESSPRASAKKSMTPASRVSKAKVPPSSSSKSPSAELNHLREKVHILTEQLQNRDVDTKDSLQTLTEQLQIKAASEKHAMTKVQSLTEQLDEKENQNRNLQNELRESEQAAHDAKLAAEESKAETLEVRRHATLAVEETKSAKSETLMIGGEEVKRLKEEIADLKATNEILDREKDGLEDSLSTTQRQISSLHHELERERESHNEDMHNLRKEITEARSQASTFEKELTQTTEKTALRDDKNVSHYKERAKLQAELLAWQRKVKELEKDKTEADNAFENLTLDKEQLLEKCEDLEDKYEEFKIDAESAQIEADELRMELEDTKKRAENTEATISIGAASGGASSEADEVTQALSVQNSRLREAIIRLREQASIEKMELTRQMRAAEKDSGIASSLKEEVVKLSKNENKMKEEIKELKDMVDQGSAFEQMVEDLSERVLAVEDNNITLQSMIRELEEGGELSAEMEEAQTEEINILMSELQNRESVVLNLEEAIKMQRRRELDFQRTVGNYRMTIETLQKERDVLVSEIGGREGVQEGAILASQKALAQAAQSVADAALARKEEAEASFNLIDAQVKSHLAERLEDFLPQSVASSEISAVKGELLLSKIAMKSSLSLSSVFDLFAREKDRASSVLAVTSFTVEGPDKLSLSRGLIQKIRLMLHQTKFSRLAIDISSECIRLLSASQWPSLLSSDASIDLGTFVAHTVPSLDSSISEQLLLLKKEGCLSPHQSNLNVLTQALATTQAAVKKITNEAGIQLVPESWSPPSLEASKSISMAKFYCQGILAVISTIIADDNDKAQHGALMLHSLMERVDKLCSEISLVSSNFSGADLTNESVIDSVTSNARDISTITFELFLSMETLCSSQEITTSQFPELNAKILSTSNAIAKISAFFRTNQIEGEGQIPLLSPESTDPWVSVVQAATKALRVSGESDLNYEVRGRTLEEQLSLAVENDAKLSIADAKIKNLEKNLSTRSKEVLIQNTRLQELETLLVQSGSLSSPRPPDISIVPSAEASELKEEIKVLNETMEVLLSQVDEYEREIRTLKDKNSRGSRNVLNSAKKGPSLDTDFSLSSLGIGSPQKTRQDLGSSNPSLEAALFWPALRSALSDASMWKSKCVSDKFRQLPPISGTAFNSNSDLLNQQRLLSLACADVRLAKASIGIIKLDDSISLPRLMLTAGRWRTATAIRRLESVTETARFVVAAKVA